MGITIRHIRNERRRFNMILQRRKLLIGLASSLAAPAIVRIQNIMPVRALAPPQPVRWGPRFRLQRWDGAERDFGPGDNTEIALWNIAPLEQLFPYADGNLTVGTAVKRSLRGMTIYYQERAAEV